MVDIQQLAAPSEVSTPAVAPGSLSGRYVYNGGVSSRRDGVTDGNLRQYTRAELQNPMYALPTPVFINAAREGPGGDELSFTLHVDIDGPEPLGVVSGELAGRAGAGDLSVHFIGRVSQNNPVGPARTLIVEDFRFAWPASGHLIDRLELSISAAGGTPSADVTFIAVASDQRHGPYNVTQESTFFRHVEIEVDVEEGALPVEPYLTTTHPTRPASLPAENLTLESVFAKAGISITRSASSSSIAGSGAGDDARWSSQELHDAMESHWSSFANRSQWKMWIFLAVLADSDSLGGIMFDADIQEPGGVDRQGTAVFTHCPHFHTAAGAYPKANSPAPEAAQRELFFNLIHETGHAFNLAHSFQKRLGSPWKPPPWIPLVTAPQALSWMNYPDEASPGGGFSAVWFYERFRFRFDDAENLFLRHAPSRFIEMGNETWFQNHGRVALGTVDPRLELVVRSRSDTLEFGEAAFVEFRLKNVSDDPVLAHCNLYPSDGFVEVAVTNPRGERRPWIPIAHTRAKVETAVLAPGEAVFRELNVTMGQYGFPFKEPGPYRIEASYHNLDGGTTAAVMQLHVAPPSNYDDLRAVRTLFDAGVGRVLQVGGSRVMEEANDKIDWVKNRIGDSNPAGFYLDAVRAIPLAKRYKLLKGDADEIQIGEEDPEFVQRRLTPLVERPAAAADVVGHIVYKRLVETYTDAALETNNQDDARRAQSQMLELFRHRNVVQPVIEEIEHKVNELK